MAFCERVMGNILVRDSGLVMTGHTVNGHTHAFDHVTYFPRGTWEIWRLTKIVNNAGAYVFDVNGEQLWHETHRRIVKPGWFGLIEKDCKHGFTLLEGPGMYHCIYSHRDPDTHEVLEEYNGWEGASS